jgi:hypothetical protein
MRITCKNQLSTQYQSSFCDAQGVAWLAFPNPTEKEKKRKATPIVTPAGIGDSSSQYHLLMLSLVFGFLDLRF